MKTLSAFLILTSAFFLGSCAQFPNANTTSPAANVASDVQRAATEAIADYADIKSGNANMAWALSKGAYAYEALVKTSADIKSLAKAWTGNTGDSQKLADKLARIFAASSASPAAKTAAIAAAAQGVAANTGP
jgi:sulfur relay (sulfurtransferase) DsrC/TusE family protein